MTVLRQGAAQNWPARDEGLRALDRWVSEDLARRHGAAFTEELPGRWLSLIAAATERDGGERRRPEV